MVYTHGYTVFKDEEAAREYVKKEIQERKENWEKTFKIECTEIVEKVKRKGKKEIHIFSCTYPEEFNCSKVGVMSNSYVAQEI